MFGIGKSASTKSNMVASAILYCDKLLPFYVYPNSLKSLQKLKCDPTSYNCLGPIRLTLHLMSRLSPTPNSKTIQFIYESHLIYMYSRGWVEFKHDVVQHPCRFDNTICIYYCLPLVCCGLWVWHYTECLAQSLRQVRSWLAQSLAWLHCHR